MVSFKKILLSAIIFTSIFIWSENFFLIHKHTSTSSANVAPPSLNQRKIALTEKQPILPNSKILDVSLITQMDSPVLYNGCEVTSLAMVLNYNGYNVTKNQLADQIKTVPLNYANGLKGNPNVGFVGDMQVGPGLGVYNGPIYDLAKKIAGKKAVNLTKSPFTDLLKVINKGEPVWVITTANFVPVPDSDFEQWATPQGTINITFDEHSVVITGYDEQSIYINNPYGGKNLQVDRDSFEKAWEQMGSQAVAIEK